MIGTTSELAAITDTKYGCSEYAQNYSAMTSDQAESYIKERAAVEESIMKLRLKYFPVFRQVLSGKATALFCQIRLAARLDHGFAVDLANAAHRAPIELVCMPETNKNFGVI